MRTSLLTRLDLPLLLLIAVVLSMGCDAAETSRKTYPMEPEQLRGAWSPAESTSQNGQVELRAEPGYAFTVRREGAAPVVGQFSTAGKAGQVPENIQFYADEPFTLPGMETVPPSLAHTYGLSFEGDDVLVLTEMGEGKQAWKYARVR